MSRLPGLQEMQAFATRAGCDLTSAYLALPKINEFKLPLDHPRAAKLARSEANGSMRAEWSQGICLEKAENVGSPAGFPGLNFHEIGGVENLREVCRTATSDFSLAPGQIDEESEQEQRIARMMQLKHQVKPGDREVLESRFEQGLSIKEIAVKKEQTDKAIYASFARMQKLMRAAVQS